MPKHRGETTVVTSVSRRPYYFLRLLLIPLVLLGLFSPTVSADGGAPQLVYIAGTTQGISIIDIAQRHVTGTIALAGDPHTVQLSPDGQLLYVTQPSLGQVAVIVAKTKKTFCTASLPGQPSLLALSLDASVLYVAGQGDTSVRALNPATCAVQQTFKTNEPIYGLAVTAAGYAPPVPNQLWITGTTSLTIFSADGRLLNIVPIAGGPQDISIPAGFSAYVTTRAGTVVAVDLSTRRVFRTLLSGGQFGPMDYDANTGEVYVPDREHNQLDVLAPVLANTALTPQEPNRIIHLSASPQSVAITSDGQFGFVALSDGQVVMLDVPGRSTITTFAVGGTPHALITGLYPPLTSPTPISTQTAVPPSSARFLSPLLLLIVAAVLAEALLLGTLWFLWRRRT
jgi:DNA-binding beta-propeller fold protein YncE